ncbi:hypothetical protein T492DRAFT_1043555, partial [Pavlovales sp. CCMP2436]
MTDASSAARNQGAMTALPGSNSRCGCSHGARQASACARRGGKGGLRPAPADYRDGARAAGQCRAQFRLFRTGELRACARTSLLVSRPLPVTFVAPAPSHRPATRWHVGNRQLAVQRV